MRNADPRMIDMRNADPRMIDMGENTSQLEEKREKTGQETPTGPHSLNLSPPALLGLQ